MRIEDLKTILGTVGIPVAYNAFPDEDPQKAPYICYRVLRDNNFVADGQIYVKADVIQIELYTKTKDVELEDKVENALSFCVWSKEEEYIQEEKIYQIVYEIEV